MDTRQLERALQDVPGFRGVYALDELPKQNDKRPALYVVNSEPSCMKGEHWIAIYFPKQGLPEFFDSFARTAFAPELRQLLGNVYLHNRKARQSPTSDTCGQHVVYYARERARGLAYKNIYYTNTLAGNDVLVKEYLKGKI